jgi:transcriptional regulator with XRE-family HTH domain
VLLVYNKEKNGGNAMSHREIFSTNLKRKMEEAGKTRMDIVNALSFSYYTVTDWVKGKKMPRMDKVEKLAKYFDCLISDLIEEKKQSAEGELSIQKKELIQKVMQMSDEELQKLDLLLRLVESK